MVAVAEEAATRVSLQIIKAELFRGPMPSPAIMEKYERLHPGATKFFFDQFQKQTEHRQSIEKIVITGNVVSTGRGQWMAFVLFLLVLGVGTALILMDKEVTGFILAIAGLMAELALFFYRRKKTDKELPGKE